MNYTVNEIAQIVQGEVIGNGDIRISAARPLSEAQPGDLTFVEHPNLQTEWEASGAVAAIVTNRMPAGPKPLIIVHDPLMAFVAVIKQFRGQTQLTPPKIDPSAKVHATAIISPGVTVGPYVVIGEDARIGARTNLHAGVVVGARCELGEDCELFPHVVLYADCILGQRVMVHANSVIGADGFGYRMQAGKHVKVPQLGCVHIGDDVEIGACSTIDRGTFSPTTIGDGTKIDNLVMIAHNVKVGKHNVLCSQVGIAGSCSTGDYVVMAGQVGVVDHCHVGDRVTIGAKSGVHTNIGSDRKMLGFPIMPYKEQLRMMATLRKLPDLKQEVKRIMQHLGLEETPAPQDKKAA